MQSLALRQGHPFSEVRILLMNASNKTKFLVIEKTSNFNDGVISKTLKKATQIWIFLTN